MEHVSPRLSLETFSVPTGWADCSPWSGSLCLLAPGWAGSRAVPQAAVASFAVFLKTPWSYSCSWHLFVTRSQPNALFQAQFVFPAAIRYYYGCYLKFLLNTTLPCCSPVFVRGDLVVITFWQSKQK